MNSRSPLFVLALFALLALTLPACLPPSEQEKERAEVTRRAATTPAPTPVPKPGSWMYEKRENPLDIKDKALRSTPKK